MTTDTIPTLAHAVRIGSDLSLYRERERAELVIAHAHGGVLVELVDRAEHERVVQELRRQCAEWKAAYDAWQPAGTYAQGLSNTVVLPAGMLGMHCGDALVTFVEQLRGERDKLREQVAFVERHLGVISGVLGSLGPLQIDDIAARLHLLIADRDDLAARLAEIEAQKPSMYVLRSTAGSVRPTVVTRKALLSCVQADRVDAGEDHLDPLFARPAPAAGPSAQRQAARAAVQAIYFADSSDYLGALWNVVRALRPDLVDLLAADERAAFEAVQDAPERAEPEHAEDALGMFCAVAGLIGRDRVVCDHSRSAGDVCVSPRECVHQRPRRCGPDGCSDSVACPRKGGVA